MKKLFILTVTVLALSACQMNQKEQRAVVGGGIGAAGGAVAGDLTGFGAGKGALIGGGAGALLGAVTAEEEPKKEIHIHNHCKKNCR